MKYQNNIPYIRKGLDLKRYIFSGGRLCVQMGDHGGVTQVTYFGEQRFGDVHLYKNSDAISAWLQIFRCFLSLGDNLYYLEFNKTRFYPFGYSSECCFEDVAVRHEFILLNDAMVFRIRILKNPGKKKVAMAMLHMDAFSRIGKATREWSGFQWAEPGRILASVAIDRNPPLEAPSPLPHEPLTNNRFPNKDTEYSETHVAIISDHALHLRHENPNQKHNVYSECFEEECVQTVAFGHDDSFLSRVRKLRNSAGAEADQVLKGYREGLKDQPSIQLKDPAVQSFAANARATLECVKVRDIPGVMRSANFGYWMWGWDTLAHSQVFNLLHDNRGVADILAVFKKYCDPKLGLFHQLMTNMKPCLSMHYSVQCLYAITLHGAYLFTGDRRLLETYFDFAKMILDHAGVDEVGDTGLIRGVGVYPDAVAQLDQTGDDIATLNNSIYYQALRAMEDLAGEMDRPDEARELDARAGRLLSNFHRLYDSDQGFFYDSICASDFSPRKHYVMHAILWLTPFARDLVKGHEKEICAFMTTHLRARHGFRLMPKWDTRYMADGNNQGYYDPFVERFYREMMKAGRNKEGTTEFFSNVAWFWNQLTVPEAMTAEAENHGLTVDNLASTLPFSTRAWYSILVNTMTGFEIDRQGIVLAPANGPEISIKNLTIRDSKVDLCVAGKGWKVRRVTLNGKAIKAPFQIPYHALKKHNKIVVLRK